jgi:hypothetical protein
LLPGLIVKPFAVNRLVGVVETKVAVVIVEWTNLEWWVVGNRVGNADNEAGGQVHLGDKGV